MLLRRFHDLSNVSTAVTARHIVYGIGTINTEHNGGRLLVAAAVVQVDVVQIVVLLRRILHAGRVVTDAGLASDDHFARCTARHFVVVVVIVQAIVVVIVVGMDVSVVVVVRCHHLEKK